MTIPASAWRCITHSAVCRICRPSQQSCTAWTCVACAGTLKQQQQQLTPNENLAHPKRPSPYTLTFLQAFGSAVLQPPVCHVMSPSQDSWLQKSIESLPGLPCFPRACFRQMPAALPLRNGSQGTDNLYATLVCAPVPCILIRGG